MSQAVNHVELLMQLGLTLNEAKVYITLSEMATARALSRNSGVTREFIYQILPKLYGKGIVEVAITTPKTFKAVPLKEAYEILMNHREKENKELQQKIKEVCRKRLEINTQGIEEPQIIMISPGKAIHSRIAQEYEEAQKSVEITIPLKKFLNLVKFFEDISKAMAKKKVKMRIIVEKQTQEKIEKYEALKPLLELKFVNISDIRGLPLVEMMIFDEQRLMLSTSTKEQLDKMTWLYTNNPFIVKLATNYFETRLAMTTTKSGHTEKENVKVLRM